MKNPIVSLLMFLFAMWLHIYGYAQIEEGGPWWNFFSIVVALWAATWLLVSKGWNSLSNRKISMLEILTRGVLAIVFVKHGIGKVLAGPSGDIFMFVVGLIEVGGALVMIAGPRKLRMWGALGIMAIMLGAIFKVHFNAGYSMGGGWEYQFLLFALSWAIYVSSGGWCPLSNIAKKIYSRNNGCSCENSEGCCSK
tara:strand:- start:384 stop:968 length:585 start_codon:yes stop_codon:yes gene_type:complete